MIGTARIALEIPKDRQASFDPVRIADDQRYFPGFENGLMALNEKLVRNKAMHTERGVRAEGTREILGPWLEQNKGRTIWRSR